MYTGLFDASFHFYASKTAKKITKTTNSLQGRVIMDPVVSLPNCVALYYPTHLLYSGPLYRDLQRACSQGKVHVSFYM